MAIPFHRFGRLNLLWAAFFFAGSPRVKSFHDGLSLLPLRITPENYLTPDYFPLFLWFGIYLLGITARVAFTPGK